MIYYKTKLGNIIFIIRNKVYYYDIKYNYIGSSGWAINDLESQVKNKHVILYIPNNNEQEIIDKYILKLL